MPSFGAISLTKKHIEQQMIFGIEPASEASALLIPRPTDNIVGLSTECKEVRGKILPAVKCITFSVKKKLPQKDLSADEFIRPFLPLYVPGEGFTDREIPTDVVETGGIEVAAYTTPARPAPGEYSVGNQRLNTCGTLGAWLKTNLGTICVSCDHVLSSYGQGQVGDPLIQPCGPDGGTINDLIGYLSWFSGVKWDNGSDTP